MNKKKRDHEIEKMLEERIKWQHFWEILHRSWIRKIIVISILLLMVLSNMASEDILSIVSDLIKLMFKE